MASTLRNTTTGLFNAAFFGILDYVSANIYRDVMHLNMYKDMAKWRKVP